MDSIAVLCPDPTGPEVEEDWLKVEAMAGFKEREIPLWDKLWYQDRIWEYESLIFLITKGRE
jgi:hypothetical protein